jgi:four helix bundle protein
MKIQNLQIWEKSMNLVEEIYEITKKFPNEERFGLISQMRRCAVSIPSNISEGYGRKSPKEFLQFLCIARGSLCELETQIIIAKRLKFLQEEEKLLSLISEIHKMLHSFSEKLKTNV